MKRAFLSVILAIFLLFPTAISAENPALVQSVRKAVGLLYSQDESGSLKMRCTATAFEKTGKGYKFVSAAHCIGDDDTNKERSASGIDIPFYITFDETDGAKRYHQAKVIWVGYQHRGEDFAVFEVATKETWATVPLGDEKEETEGAQILNVASPLGLGKQVFYGTITSLNLDRPIVDGRGINWKGALLLNISAGPGSSGSALVSVEHQNIIGFLVGTIGGENIVGIPVNRFKAVDKAVKDDKYSYWKPVNLNPDGTPQE